MAIAKVVEAGLLDGLPEFMGKSAGAAVQKTIPLFRWNVTYAVEYFGFQDMKLTSTGTLEEVMREECRGGQWRGRRILVELM